MLTKYNHQKRQTIPGTLHGTMNQITKSMFHAFVKAYDNPGYDFYIVTENTSFGDCYFEKKLEKRIKQVTEAHHAPEYWITMAVVGRLFDYEETYKLDMAHLERISTILKWRKENEYQIYTLTNMPILLTLEKEDDIIFENLKLEA